MTREIVSVSRAPSTAARSRCSSDNSQAAGRIHHATIARRSPRSSAPSPPTRRPARKHQMALITLASRPTIVSRLHHRSRPSSSRPPRALFRHAWHRRLSARRHPRDESGHHQTHGAAGRPSSRSPPRDRTSASRATKTVLGPLRESGRLAQRRSSSVQPRNLRTQPRRWSSIRDRTIRAADCENILASTSLTATMKRGRRPRLTHQYVVTYGAAGYVDPAEQDRAMTTTKAV